MSESSLPELTLNNDIDEILRSIIGSQAPDRSSNADKRVNIDLDRKKFE